MALRNGLRIALHLVKQTLDGWSEVRGTLLAAGLSYYAIFSLTPLFGVAVSIAGLVYGESAAAGKLVEAIGVTVSPKVAAILNFMVGHARRNPPLGLTTWVSLAISLVSASILFVQLKAAINVLWGLAPQPGKALIITIRTHFFSFLLVFGVALLLLVSMVLGAGLVYLEQLLNFSPPELGLMTPELNFGLTFLVFSLLFAVIYKFLPDAQIYWRDVWIGAACTSLAFTAGEFLIGYYLGRIDLSKTYGAIGSILLLLVWVYYSMQIILIGAKFTQVLADEHGKKVLPSGRAELIVRHRIKNNQNSM